MKDKLYHNPKLEVRKSPIQGYGVFAKEDIKKEELVEECHYCELEEYFDDDNFHRYIYSLFDGELPSGQPKEQHCVVFGYASLYNSAKEVDDVNIYWRLKKHINYKIFVFQATKDIKKDEELLQWYLDPLDINK